MTRFFTSLVFSLSLIGVCIGAPLKEVAPTTVDVNGINLGVVELGDPNGEPVLMVMGLGSSYVLWGDGLTQGLVEAGYRVILFDNRDVGASQKMDHLGEPVLWWELLKNNLGFGVNAAYSLSDMADDAVALLDQLGIKQAHVAGASMGGMIAQVIAFEHPQRVRSLISIMSTSGAEHLPDPTPEAQASLENATFTDEEGLQAMNDRGF